jgi:hypothetical protein
LRKTRRELRRCLSQGDSQQPYSTYLEYVYPDMRIYGFNVC